ncbi:MAG: hypothetical protein H7296_14395 [Bacteroidia bacterium]|nr:hypothetical protein [Bacteroidia bacterium]
MNSLQLVSKIKSKAEDINLNIHEILALTAGLNNIQKELLKKQCVDLYELLLKLKTESDQTEDKPNTRSAPLADTLKPAVSAITASPLEETISNGATAPVLVTDNFKEVMSWADRHEETLDSIEQKVELIEPEKTEINVNSYNYTKPVVEPILMVDTKPTVELKKEIIDTPIEINLEKAIENKRIQYTVMPAIEEPKPVPLNSNFAEKEISYNERIAQKTQNNPIPLAEKTVEARIENLKTAINLNKKIALVNDLFKENVVEYAKAIDKLNNAGGLTEALLIFNQLKHTYHWNNSNELVQELEKLLKRRHD